MQLSIVVPCYNEEKNIQLFYDKVFTTFKNTNIKYEIVFVNDGSSDKTSEILNQFYNKGKQKIQIINFSRNFGKEAAMYAGLKEATGELVAIIDADLQQNPEYILKMMDILNREKECDSVAAYQAKRKEGKILAFCKKMFYKLINSISSVTFTPDTSDFRIFRRKMVDAIINMSEYHRFSKGIFSFVGFNTYYMPYEVEARKAGSSKWNFWKLFKYAIDGIIGFTTVPLKLPFVFSGFLFFAFIICFIIFLFYNLNFLSILLLVLLFIMSLLFFVVGIMGEYMARIYIQGKNRPIYIIKEHKRGKDKK